MRVTESEFVLPGFLALKRRGDIVWVGPVGSPTEDVDCDEIVLHPNDADRLLAEIDRRAALADPDHV